MAMQEGTDRVRDSGSKFSASGLQGFGPRPRSAALAPRSTLVGPSPGWWSFVSVFQSARFASASTTRSPSPRLRQLRRVVVPRPAFFRFRSACHVHLSSTRLTPAAATASRGGFGHSPSIHHGCFGRSEPPALFRQGSGARGRLLGAPEVSMQRRAGQNAWG